MPCVWIFIRNTGTASEERLQYRRGQVINIYDGDDIPDGCAEKDTNVFLRYYCTDKSRAEVVSYLERWNRLIVFEVVNGPDPVTGFRRVKCSNEKINQSQTVGGWTQEQADNITTQWNADPLLNKLYPQENLVTVGFTPKDLIQEGEFTDDQAAAYQFLVRDTGENYDDAQRIWAMTEASCQAFEATDGFKTGTAAQLVNNHLQNGLET